MSWWNLVKRLHRNVWALALTSFLNSIASEMIITLLPIYLYQTLKAPHIAIGLIEGVSLFISSFFKVFSGYTSDRIGYHRYLTAAGYFLSAIARPLLNFAHGWGLVAAVKWGDKLGKGLRGAPRDVLLGKSLHPSQRGTAYSLHHSAETLGGCLSLAIALIVVTSNDQSIGLSTVAYRLLVFLSLPFGLSAVLSVLCFARDIPKNNLNSSTPTHLSHSALTPAEDTYLLARRLPPPSARWIGKLGSVYYTLLLIFFIFQVGNPSPAFVILLAQERGMTVAGVVTMLLAHNMVYSLLVAPAGWLSDKLNNRYSNGRAYIIIAGWLLRALLTASIGLSSTSGAVAWLYVSYGVYLALTESLLKVMIVDVVPEHSSSLGTALGVYNAMQGFADIFAGLIAGYLFDRGLQPAAFLFTATSSLFCACLLLIWRQSVQPTEEDRLWTKCNNNIPWVLPSANIDAGLMPHMEIVTPSSVQGETIWVHAVIRHDSTDECTYDADTVIAVKEVAIPRELIEAALGRTATPNDLKLMEAAAHVTAGGGKYNGAMVMVNESYQHRQICVIGAEARDVCARQERRRRPGWTWTDRWTLPGDRREKEPLLGGN